MNDQEFHTEVGGLKSLGVSELKDYIREGFKSSEEVHYRLTRPATGTKQSDLSILSRIVH